MKIFIGIKYQKESLDTAKRIKEIVKSLGHDAYCFAIDSENIADEKGLMQRALSEIEKSDIVLLESSHDSFGVGIEGGYAFAKGKKIVVIGRKTGETSRTLKGISNKYLTYADLEDLRFKLKEIL